MFSSEHFPEKHKKPLNPAAARFIAMLNKTTGNAHQGIDKSMSTAQLLLNLYKEMGYGIAGVGQKDLCAGVNFLKREAGKRGITLLSANLTRNGKKLFNTETVIERDKTKIGFTAVTSCSVLNYHRGEMECAAPAAALKPIVAKLKKECDFVVLLSNVSDSKNRNIVHSIDGIDLIIKSGKGVQTYQPEMYETVPAVMTHPKGKSVGVVTLEKDKQGEVGINNNLVLLTTKFPVDKTTQARLDAFSRKWLKHSQQVNITTRSGTTGDKTSHAGNKTREDKPGN